MNSRNAKENKHQTASKNTRTFSILHVIDSLEIGGLERTVVRLAIAQKKSGHSVSVVTLFRNGPLEALLKNERIQVQCLKKRRGLDLFSIEKIRMIARKNTEIIHTHNPVAHYYATLATLGLKVSRISTRHDMGMHLKRKRMESLYQIALIKTHAVVLVCEAARDQFVSRSIIPEKLATVVYNGIEPTLSPIKLSITNNQRRVELGLPETGIILGSIGRLNKVKDYETLIRAFSLLTESIREVSLVIVGDGPERQKLQNLIDELELGQRVKLIGERNDIDSLLEQFSVFALTSKTEGLSVALIEAAWAGLPIVATDVGGNREIVDDGITGYLVQVGAAAETSEKISILIRNEQFRNKASKLIREKAEIKWSLHAMEKRYEDIYQKIFP